MRNEALALTSVPAAEEKGNYVYEESKQRDQSDTESDETSTAYTLNFILWVRTELGNYRIRFHHGSWNRLRNRPCGGSRYVSGRVRYISRAGNFPIEPGKVFLHEGALALEFG